MYEWYIVETEEVFYVGKGSGDRYKTINGRNKFFKCMYNSHRCDVRIKYDNLTEKEAFAQEKELINYYRNNTTFRLTNQTDGGEGSSGWKPSQEIKEKMSKALKKKWNDPDYKERVIKSRHDISSTFQSKEFKEKISRIVSGNNNPNYHNYWSEKQKQHLSKIQKNNPLYKNENNPNAKKIICVETGEVFSCIKYAQEKYKIRTFTSLSVALKNKIRTAGEMHWVYYDECFLDNDYRLNYLLEVLKKDKTRHSVQCVDDGIIYSSIAKLARLLNISEKIIRISLLEQKKPFTYKEKTYILIE